MKRILLIAVLLGTMITATTYFVCIAAPSVLFGKGIKGSGNIVTRTIDAPDFDRVDAARAVKVVITGKATGKITIEADDNIMEYVVSRPEKGLQKRVNLMQQTTNSDLSRHYLPRQLRHLILQEYLSGVKTARQLSEEHGIPMSTIHKMGQRWKAKNSCSFVSTPNPYPIMSRVTSEEASELLSENKALRRRLEEALLRLEGYEIMGDILQEEYGIDLLKKSAAGQSSVSKKDTQQ